MTTDHVARVIERCNIKVKNESHKRCIELFNPFMSRFKENPNSIKSVFERFLGIKLTADFRETACFNGRYDGELLKEPFNLHLYIQYDHVRVHLYCIACEADLRDAFSYQEKGKDIYKVLVVNSKMKDSITEDIQDKSLIIDEEDIERLSEMRMT